MKSIQSYKTGRTINGKPETRIGYFVGKDCVMSFPAQLSGYKMVDLRDVPAILRGDAVIESDGYRARPYRWADDSNFLLGEGYIKEDCVPVAQMKIAETPMVLESSYRRADIGSHASTMQLSALLHTPGMFHIEWDIPTLETTEEICIYTEKHHGKPRMTDYDGVMALPAEAVALLRANGVIVPREFQ